MASLSTEAIVKASMGTFKIPKPHDRENHALGRTKFADPLTPSLQVCSGANAPILSTHPNLLVGFT